VRGTSAHGVYIDSFIPPDRLEASYLRENLTRVRAAAACAIKVGAKVVSLGGFSSILIEGNLNNLPDGSDTVFTTGNSLTVALIVQGIKRMCWLEGRSLQRSTLLIVGATGDVGSGVARCLAPFVKRVFLCARNVERLQALAKELAAEGIEVHVVRESDSLPTNANVAVCAASLTSASLLLGGLAPDVIVCDAGYPKNLAPMGVGAKVFFGGLGQIAAGMTLVPDLYPAFNRHPFPDVFHGCLLEGITLALEARPESFSRGRGFITRERVQEIESMAERHGIGLAPLYNANGPLEQAVYQTEGILQ
jgi:predicted amino acid dehydrogenase